MLYLSLIFGIVVGFSLGLTGGGGSVFAVPLLVYGLSLSPREAVGVSLAAVGGTALAGVLFRLRSRQIELLPGTVFALCGMIGAPVGSWIAGRTPDSLLLGLFAALMAIVAIRLWIGASRAPEETRAVRALRSPGDGGVSCRRDPAGRLRLTSQCLLLLALSGILTGSLSGLFGVGGGFVIVPALVFFSGMEIHRAVSTSLLIIALISASGLTAHLLSGQSFDASLAAAFTAGGVGGLLLGGAFVRRVSGPTLQRLFAGSIVLVAGMTVVKSLTM